MKVMPRLSTPKCRADFVAYRYFTMHRPSWIQFYGLVQVDGGAVFNLANAWLHFPLKLAWFVLETP